jgi:acyl-CoA hydrolase
VNTRIVLNWVAGGLLCLLLAACVARSEINVEMSMNLDPASPVLLASVKEDIEEMVLKERPTEVEVRYCTTPECSQMGVYQMANAVMVFFAEDFPEIKVYDSPMGSTEGAFERTAIKIVFN